MDKVKRPDPDDPLNEIIQLQSSISDSFLETIKDSCDVTMEGVIKTINKCPHLSAEFKDCEAINYDIDERYKHVEQIVDGTASKPETLLELWFIC